MPPPRARPNPREELIAIALELLDQRHPEELSLREVARRAGLTSGAPSHHFGNKLGLLAACAEVAWSELCTRMEDTGSDSTPAVGLRQKARSYIDYALAHPGPYRLIMSRLFEDGVRFEQVAEWRSRVMGGVIALIDQGTPDAEDPTHPWRRGLAMWALLHGHVTLVLDGAIAEAKVDNLSRDICRMAAVVALLPVDAEAEL